VPLEKPGVKVPSLIVRLDKVASVCAKMLVGTKNDAKSNKIQKAFDNKRLAPLLLAFAVRFVFHAASLLSDILLDPSISLSICFD